MTLILHLSDLHLRSVLDSPALGDHKTQLVARSERETQHSMLHRTLAGLGRRLTAEGRSLDAIVMSGDIADRNEDGGYVAFLALLDALGALRPDPSRIVVVPGNHDVERGLVPGLPQRYDRFVRHVRGAGFVTPLLEGVDAVLPRGKDIFKHVVRIDDLEIVPINTSAYAQVRVDIGIDDAAWASAVAAAEKVGGAKAAKALENLRIIDAARVADQHLESIHRMLTDAVLNVVAPKNGPARPHAPVRVGVLHHQLLPVSTREEIKAFESFTNLGLLRQFLRDNQFALALHGHKHKARSYPDYVMPFDGGEPHAPRQLRVIAGPSPSGQSLDENDVCRLLDIDTDACRVQIESIPVLPPGHNPKRGQVQGASFDHPGAATVSRAQGVIVVEGRTVKTVYSRMISALTAAAGSGEAENVVCRVLEPPTDAEIAPLYPGFRPTGAASIGDGDDAPSLSAQVAQFKELIQWWQTPEILGLRREPGFNHGSRLFRYDGHLDQVRAIADALVQNPRTTRAVAILLQPSADHIDVPLHPFPSFCLVQFLIALKHDTDAPRLECVAFFRKQEARYWWLVNVAELASLQRRVVDAIKPHAKQEARNLANLRLGSITTIAARAHVGGTPPKVQVPKIDQYFANGRERLVDMAHAVIWERMPGREALGHDWREVLYDLIPAERRDPDGVAVALSGLEYLKDQVEAHVSEATPEERGTLTELAGALQSIWAENNRYASEQKLENVTDDRHSEWRGAVSNQVRRAIELTVALLGTSPGVPTDISNAVSGSEQTKKIGKASGKREAAKRTTGKSPGLSARSNSASRRKRT